jgi:hypothetical protein
MKLVGTRIFKVKPSASISRLDAREHRWRYIGHLCFKKGIRMFRRGTGNP